MTARKVAKPKKVAKPGRGSRTPLYILIVAVIIIFVLLGVGLYYSVGSVNPNLLLMVVVIIGATILIEFMMKRDLYFGRRRDEDAPEDESGKEGGAPGNAGETGMKDQRS
jgi:hypothetical protein